MALDESAMTDLLAALRAGGGLDVVREVLQALIDVEAIEVIGAGRYQRSASRTTHRNGSCSRLLSTKAGDVELKIPKLREGSFFPALLEPRRRIDRALLAVVMQAYVHGTSTRKVDDLVKALGVDSGISKSEVSRICAELMARWPPSGLAPWPTPPSRMCSWTPPASRPVWTAGSSPGGGDRHRRGCRWRLGGAGRGRRRQRGRRLLDRVPAVTQGRRAGRRAAGHLRCPHRAQGRHRRRHGRSQLATLPGPLGLQGNNVSSSVNRPGTPPHRHRPAIAPPQNSWSP
jgi:Transposase, Mutator family